MKIKTLLFVIILIIHVFPQTSPGSKKELLLDKAVNYYIYTPITGNVLTLEQGIFVNSSDSRVKTNKLDTLASKLQPLKYTYVSRYEHNIDDLSDSTLTIDSLNTQKRYFDVSMYPVGAEFTYRYAIIERKVNGVNYYKTGDEETAKIQVIPEALYDADSYPLFDSEGNLLYPAEE